MTFEFYGMAGQVVIVEALCRHLEQPMNMYLVLFDNGSKPGMARIRRTGLRRSDSFSPIGMSPTNVSELVRSPCRDDYGT